MLSRLISYYPSAASLRSRKKGNHYPVGCGRDELDADSRWVLRQHRPSVAQRQQGSADQDEEAADAHLRDARRRDGYSRYGIHPCRLVQR